MNCLCEALGIALPGNGTVPAVYSCLLYTSPGFRPLNVFGVAEDLPRLSGKKVDVFELSELDAGPFRDAVLRDAVLL